MNPPRPAFHRPCSLACAALIPLIAAIGCSSSASPRVSVGDARIGDSTPDGAKGTFQLFAENPNRDPLLLRDIRYEVSVDGATIFEGRRAAGATLSGFGGQTLTVPFVTTAANTLRPGAAVRITGELEYSEAGALAKTLMDAGLADPSESFAGESTLGETSPADTILPK